MHTSLIPKIQRPVKDLRQGHIFFIKGCKFLNNKNQEVEFSAFYPEVDLSNIKYGVVLTQDCDLEQSKVSHINVALLEPFTRNAEAIYQNQYIDKCCVEYEGQYFWSEDASHKYLGDNLLTLIGNNSQHFVFLSLKISGKNKYFYVNLTKVFPFKLKHIDSFFACSSSISKYPSLSSTRAFFSKKLEESILVIS